MHHRPLIRTFTAGVLNVIVPLAIRLPDVNLDPFDGLAAGILYGAKDKARFSIRIVCDLSAVWFYLSFVGMEWSKNRTFSACWRLRMVDTVHQERKTENV